MMTTGIDISRAKGWKASLQLEYSHRPDRTVLSRNLHSGPLVVQRPLYPEGDVCHTCILHPPSGVVGGDLLEINILVKENTATLITTPGATKFYRSAGKKALQEQHIRVDDGAILEWFPQDSILFPGADAEINTKVELAATAQFIGWEILSLGMPVNGQIFNPGRLLTNFSIHRQNKPLFIDRLRVNSENDLNRSSGLRGFPVVATFVATGCTSRMLESLRKLVPHESDALYGVTLMNELLVARYLGYSTFAAHGLFTEIWKTLRPEIIEKDACPPRIWQT